MNTTWSKPMELLTSKNLNQKVGQLKSLAAINKLWDSRRLTFNLKPRGKAHRENLKEVPKELRILLKAAEEAKRGQSGMIQI